MISSKFNIIVKGFPAPGENVLFNARTQALIKIDDAFRDALGRLPGSLEGDGADTRLLGFSAALEKNGVVAKDAAQEREKLDDFFCQLKSGSRQMAFEATILTTYACNFRCVYCFEESARRDTAMDEATARRVCDWLKKRVKDTGITKAYFSFYGGEPLLNPGPIRSISREFGPWARANGIDFGFMIITNGSLVTRELVDELLPLGLRELRISVDGDRDTHDARRPFAGGAPSFDRIMDNIRAVIDAVPVAIAGNFDRDTFGGFTRLLDHLEAEGLLKKLKYVNFLPVSPRLGPQENPAAIELGNCVSYFGKDGLFREILEVKKELARRGMRAPSGLAVNACAMIISGAGVTIDPSGDIYTCNALLGHPEFASGNVAREGMNAHDAGVRASDAWKKCEPDCPYVPLCQGGCRFFSFLEHGDFVSLACKREYLDLVVPELIKLEYLNVTAGRGR